MKQSYYMKNRRQHQGSELVMEVEVNTMLENILLVFLLLDHFHTTVLDSDMTGSHKDISEHVVSF